MTVQTRSRGRAASGSAELPASRAVTVTQHDAPEDATSRTGAATRVLRSSEKRTSEPEVERPPKRSRRSRNFGEESHISVDDMIKVTSQTMKEPLERAVRHQNANSRRQTLEQHGNHEATLDQNDDDDLFVKQSEPVLDDEGDEDGQESQHSQDGHEEEAAEADGQQDEEELEGHYDEVLGLEDVEALPQESNAATRRGPGRPRKKDMSRQPKPVGDASRTTKPQTRSQRKGTRSTALRRQSRDVPQHVDNDEAASDSSDSEHEEGEEGEVEVEEEGDDEGAVHIDIPADASSKRTTQMSSTHLRKMNGEMRKAEWANTPDWDLPLIKRIKSHDYKLISPQAERLVEHLGKLFLLFKRTPRPTELNLDGYNFEEQRYHLHSKSFARKDLFSKIGQEVDDIWSSGLRIRGVSQRQRKGTADGRRQLLSDLRAYIIPVLVVNLKSVFTLGGILENPSERANSVSFLKTGHFTRTVLDILSKITGWLHRLEETLRHETGSRRGKASRAAATTATTQPGGGTASRRQLQDHILLFEMEIGRADRTLERAEEQEAERQRHIENEAAIQEAQKRKHDEEEARRRRQFELACASTRAFRDQPNPLHQQQQLSQVAGSRLGPSQSTLRNTRPRPLSAAARGNNLPADGGDEAMPIPAPSRPFRDEELNILLNELRNTQVPNLTAVARKLDRERHEVVHHAEALKRMFREIVNERGLGQPPKWAMPTT